MIYDGGSTADQWRIHILPTHGAGGHWKSIWKKMIWNPFLTWNTKINFRETKLLNVKGKTQVSSRETIFMTFNSPINYKLASKSQKGTIRLGFGNAGSYPGCHQLGQVTWSHWLSVCSFLKRRVIFYDATRSFAQSVLLI